MLKLSSFIPYVSDFSETHYEDSEGSVENCSGLRAQNIMLYVRAQVESAIKVRSLPRRESISMLNLCINRLRTSLFAYCKNAEGIQPYLGELITPILGFILVWVGEVVEHSKSEEKVSKKILEDMPVMIYYFRIVCMFFDLYPLKEVSCYLKLDHSIFEPIAVLMYHLSLDYWEAFYVCGVWLSNLCLIPISLDKIDSKEYRISLLERLLDIAKRHLFLPGKGCLSATMLLSKLIVRADVVSKDYFSTVEWILDEINSDISSTSKVYCGLYVITRLFNSAPRIVYMQSIPRYFELSEKLNHLKPKKCTLVRKMLIKFDSILAIIILEHSKYEKGLPKHIKDTMNLKNTEEILWRSMESLSDRDIDVVWTCAKSVARISYHLPSNSSKKVFEKVMDMFETDRVMQNDVDFHKIRRYELNNEYQWYGACLCIGEMARSSLLDKNELPRISLLIQEALYFSYISGFREVGKLVNEAACCVCWCLSTLYPEEDLKNFANEVYGPLVSLSLLGRELGVRRAAIYAAQELVKRTPRNNYTDISFVNYYTIANKSHSMYELAITVSEHNDDILKRLLLNSIHSLDITVREICSKTLAHLCLKHPNKTKMVLRRLREIIENVPFSYAMHSAILTQANIYLFFQDYTNTFLENKEEISLISKIIIKKLSENCRNKNFEAYFLMAFSKMIKNIAEKNEHLEMLGSKPVINDVWNIMEFSLSYEDIKLQEIASSAMGALSTSAFSISHEELDTRIIKHLSPSESSKAMRRGCVICLGYIKKFKKEAIASISKELCSIVDSKIVPLDIREAAIRSIRKLIPVIAENGPCFEIFECMSRALDDYTPTYKGCIGYNIRKETVLFFADFLNFVSSSCNIQSVVNKILKISLEKYEEVRLPAGKCLMSILENDKIQLENKQVLKSVLLKVDSIGWDNPGETSEIFLQLVPFNTYTKHVLLGLMSCCSSANKSLASSAIRNFKKYVNSKSPSDEHIAPELKKLLETVMTILIENESCPMVFYPALSFLENIAYMGKNHSHSTAQTHKKLLKILEEKLPKTNNIKNLCSIIKLCIHTGTMILKLKEQETRCVLYEYLCKALEGLVHKYPYMRNITIEYLYSSFTLLLEEMRECEVAQQTSTIVEKLSSSLESPKTQQELVPLKESIAEHMKIYLKPCGG